MKARQAGLSVVLASLVSAAAVQAVERPNVLFIAIDDLVPTIGAYGDVHAVTPAMDTLASRGTTFLNHHVQWPVCGPSRAAMSTGLLPEETGVMGFRPIRAILPEVITLPQHFRDNGYETAATGKFHDYRTVGEIVDPDMQTQNGRNTDDIPSWSIPYVLAASGFNPPGKFAVDASDRPDSDYGDHAIMAEGKTLLDSLESGDKPYFLAVGFKKPHLPFVAPKTYWDFYDRDQFTRAAFQDMPDGASGLVQDMLMNNGELLGYEPFDVTGLPTAEEELELIHGYYACTSFIDALVDELLDHLATKNDPMDPTRKMSETTIVVVWGDHGFHLGDHGKWAKHSVMERSTAAPLIIYDPRNPANGVKTNAPVNTVDIYPTLCELAGLPIPEQPLSDTIDTGRPLRGRSIAPLLQDAAASVNSGALSYIRRSGTMGYAFRTDRYRYIEWVNGSNVVTARDLYDYENDPMETRNLISDPSYATMVYQLSRAMRAEPIAKGATRLINSDPIPASGAEIDLGEGYIPAEDISAKKKDTVTLIDLTCDGVRGVSYDILRSTDLTPGSWEPALEGQSGTLHQLEMVSSREFFRIKLGENIPPAFISDPVRLPDASEGTAYSIMLSSYLEENDPGDSYTFSKIEGPDWLLIGTDGLVSGTPPTGSSGSQFIRFQVEDADGARETALFNIFVGS